MRANLHGLRTNTRLATWTLLSTLPVTGDCNAECNTLSAFRFPQPGPNVSKAHSYRERWVRMIEGLALAVSAAVIYGFFGICLEVAGKRHYKIWDVRSDGHRVVLG